MKSKLLNFKFLFITPIIFFGLFGMAESSLAADFYVDPTYTGAMHNGSNGAPWTALTNTSAWTAINSALVSDNVTVYFSARTSVSDISEDMGKAIDLTGRTDTGQNTLTIDGRSFYNTNDSAPSWSAYTGTNYMKATNITIRGESGIHYDHITVDGFISYGTADKNVNICGSYITIQNVTMFGGQGGVMIGPTSDGAHQGSSTLCPRSHDITIRNNIIHDTVGECIYVAGAGCSQNDPTGNVYCMGFPAHYNISITGNDIYNCASPGSGQGDGIDIKGGISNLTISQNTIHDLSDPNNTGVRAIVHQGINSGGEPQNNVIERNYIYKIKAEDAAIALVNSWGTPDTVTVRNNIISTTTHGGGIKVYDGSGLSLYNNTVYGAAGYGILTSSGIVDIRNNAVFGNNGNGSQSSLSGTITSSNNAYNGSWSSCGTSCVLGLSASAGADFVSPGSDFSLTASSRCRDAGVTLAGFSDDYAGTNRPQGSTWDIGAYEYSGSSSDTTPPAAPSGLSIQ